MLRGLVSDIGRIITRKTLTEPLGDAVSGFVKDLFPGGPQQLSGPSGGGGFWDSITSWLPKFATGTSYVPQDMVAVVHKGERIVPAAQNNGSFGGGVTIVQNNTFNGTQDRAWLQQALTTTKEQTKAEILDSMRRGGAFAGA